MHHLRASLLAFIGLFAFALTSAPAPAQQAWPQRPVKFVVPLGAGSGVDITARVFAERLSARWGQPVVVENRPGGDAMVAINAVLGAHDDHVLLFAPASTFTAHAYLHDKLPYKPADLIPIARVTNTLIAVGVPTALGVDTLAELAAKVRAAPSKLNYASVTGANDLLFAGFLKSENLDMAKVPYRDTVQAINDLAENRIQSFVAAYAILRPQVKAGKVKVVAITNRQHAAALADIPTATEAGFQSLNFDGLVGLIGTRELAPAARDRIANDIREIATDPAIAARLSVTGQVMSPGSAAEFSAAIEDQRTTVAAIGKTLGIKPAQ